jgi:protein-S-isoprenylcysteine O-methyltransferase Ste14
MADTEQDHAGVIAPPPLIYAAGIGLGLLLHQLAPLRWLPAVATRLVGWPLVGLGAVLSGSAATIMLRARTALEPQGATTMIVTAGPFRFTRNPIYLSFTMLTVAVAALRNSLWPVLLLPAVLQVMRKGVIEREERYLARKFGAEYVDYTARVRRWL